MEKNTEFASADLIVIYSIIGLIALGGFITGIIMRGFESATQFGPIIFAMIAALAIRGSNGARITLGVFAILAGLTTSILAFVEQPGTFIPILMVFGIFYLFAGIYMLARGNKKLKRKKS